MLNKIKSEINKCEFTVDIIEIRDKLIEIDGYEIIYNPNLEKEFLLREYTKEELEELINVEEI